MLVSVYATEESHYYSTINTVRLALERAMYEVRGSLVEGLLQGIEVVEDATDPDIDVIGRLVSQTRHSVEAPRNLTRAAEVLVAEAQDAASCGNGSAAHSLFGIAEWLVLRGPAKN